MTNAAQTDAAKKLPQLWDDVNNLTGQMTIHPENAKTLQNDIQTKLKEMKELREKCGLYFFDQDGAIDEKYCTLSAGLAADWPPREVIQATETKRAKGSDNMQMEELWEACKLDKIVDGVVMPFNLRCADSIAGMEQVVKESLSNIYQVKDGYELAGALSSNDVQTAFMWRGTLDSLRHTLLEDSEPTDEETKVLKEKLDAVMEDKELTNNITQVQEQAKEAVQHIVDDKTDDSVYAKIDAMQAAAKNKAPQARGQVAMKTQQALTALNVSMSLTSLGNMLVQQSGVAAREKLRAKGIPDKLSLRFNLESTVDAGWMGAEVPAEIFGPPAKFEDWVEDDGAVEIPSFGFSVPQEDNTVDNGLQALSTMEADAQAKLTAATSQLTEENQKLANLQSSIEQLNNDLQKTPDAAQKTPDDAAQQTPDDADKRKQLRNAQLELQSQRSTVSTVKTIKQMHEQTVLNIQTKISSITAKEVARKSEQAEAIAVAVEAVNNAKAAQAKIQDLMKGAGKTKKPKWNAESEQRSAFFTNVLKSVSSAQAKIDEGTESSSRDHTSNVAVSADVKASYAGVGGGVNTDTKTSNTDTQKNAKTTGDQSKESSEITFGCNYVVVSVRHSLLSPILNLLADAEWEHRTRSPEFYGGLFYIDQVVLVEKCVFECKDETMRNKIQSSIEQASSSKSMSVHADAQASYGFFFSANVSTDVSSTTNQSSTKSSTQASAQVETKKDSVIEPALTVKFVILKRLPPRQKSAKATRDNKAARIPQNESKPSPTSTAQPLETPSQEATNTPNIVPQKVDEAAQRDSVPQPDEAAK